jgi:hypothetical protein
MMPGAWIVTTLAWLFLSTRMGIHISSNTAAVTVLTWFVAVPLTLIAGITAIIFYLRHWSTGRGPKICASIHATFLLIAVTVTIGVLKLPDFGGQ